MDWSKGYTATFYASFVDPLTWRDIERFEIVSGKITHSDSDLLESCDLDCLNYDQSTERWVRVWMDTQQDGASSHVALFTGLATSPDKDIDGTLISTPVELYSVLKPASDVYVQRGYYAPIGVSGADIVMQLLDVIPAPITAEDYSPQLQSAIISEDGETRLTMALKILEAINWRLTISGSGEIRIAPKPTEPVVRFSSLGNDMVEPQVSVSYDWFSCPNVFRAIGKGVSATAKDEDPESPLSIPSRGREIWMEESDRDLSANETIAEYAQRRLKEEQAVNTVMSYNRRFHPEANVGDLVEIHYPRQAISGVYEITKQDINIGIGVTTSEEVKAYV